MNLNDIRELEREILKDWLNNSIYISKINKNKKFFITVPYPYTSGALHIGHGRTYTLADFYARFKKKQGFNVLYPMAYHVSGTPIMAISEKLQKKDNDTINLVNSYLDFYGETEKTKKQLLKDFENPYNFAIYFSKKFADDFKKVGLSIDFSREFTTMDKSYNDFIKWVFYKFKEKNILTKGKYPLLFDLIDKNPVGEDDIKDGDTSKVS